MDSDKNVGDDCDYEYWCDGCTKIIEDDRFHKRGEEDYLLCASCYGDLSSDLPAYQQFDRVDEDELQCKVWPALVKMISELPVPHYLKIAPALVQMLAGKYSEDSMVRAAVEAVIGKPLDDKLMIGVDNLNCIQHALIKAYNELLVPQDVEDLAPELIEVMITVDDEGEISEMVRDTVEAVFWPMFDEGPMKLFLVEQLWTSMMHFSLEFQEAVVAEGLYQLAPDDLLQLAPRLIPALGIDTTECDDGEWPEVFVDAIRELFKSLPNDVLVRFVPQMIQAMEDSEDEFSLVWEISHLLSLKFSMSELCTRLPEVVTGLGHFSGGFQKDMLIFLAEVSHKQLVKVAPQLVQIQGEDLLLDDIQSLFDRFSQTQIEKLARQLIKMIEYSDNRHMITVIEGILLRQLNTKKLMKFTTESSVAWDYFGRELQDHVVSSIELMTLPFFKSFCCNSDIEFGGMVRDFAVQAAKRAGSSEAQIAYYEPGSTELTAILLNKAAPQELLAVAPQLIRWLIEDTSYLRATEVAAVRCCLPSNHLAAAAVVILTALLAKIEKPDTDKMYSQYLTLSALIRMVKQIHSGEKLKGGAKVFVHMLVDHVVWFLDIANDSAFPKSSCAGEQLYEMLPFDDARQRSSSCLLAVMTMSEQLCEILPAEETKVLNSSMLRFSETMEAVLARQEEEKEVAMAERKEQAAAATVRKLADANAAAAIRKEAEAAADAMAEQLLQEEASSTQKTKTKKKRRKKGNHLSQVCEASNFQEFPADICVPQEAGPLKRTASTTAVPTQALQPATASRSSVVNRPLEHVSIYPEIDQQQLVSTSSSPRADQTAVAKANTPTREAKKANNKKHKQKKQPLKALMLNRNTAALIQQPCSNSVVPEQRMGDPESMLGAGSMLGAVHQQPDEEDMQQREAATCGLEDPFTKMVLNKETATATDVNAKADLDTEEVRLCIVCMEMPREIILMPCNHVQLCQGCSDAVRSCPTCRASIHNRCRVFF